MKKSFLHRRLAILVSWVAIVFAALTSVIFYITELERSNEKTIIMINQLLDTVELTAGTAAYVGNQGLAKEVLDGLIKNDIVHQARITNKQALDVHVTKNTQVKDLASIERLLVSPFDEEIVGRIVITPEASFSLEEASHSAFFAALNSTGLIALTTWLMLLVVRRYLSRPLMMVSNSLHEISAGEKARLEPLKNNQHDELGQLVTDINGLLNTLEEKFNAESSLRKEVENIEQRLRAIFETTSAGIFIIDNKERLLTANPTLNKVLELNDAEIEAGRAESFLDMVFYDTEDVRGLMKDAKNNGKAVAGDLRVAKVIGHQLYWVHCLMSHNIDASGNETYEGVVYDITDRKAAEQKLKFEADIDPLTGAFRRQVAERKLDVLHAEFGKTQISHAVLMMDLDHFKEVNDLHGHAAGDEVLKAVAECMKSCVRHDDLVCRLGGDEFLIILPNGPTIDRLVAVGNALVAAIQQPIAISDTIDVQIGGSIGIAIFNGNAETASELLERADHAMYEIKHQGRNGFGISKKLGDPLIVFQRRKSSNNKIAKLVNLA